MQNSAPVLTFICSKVINVVINAHDLFLLDSAPSPKETCSKTSLIFQKLRKVHYVEVQITVLEGMKENESLELALCS